MTRERITLTMTAMDLFMVMSEGNPGAMTVIGKLYKTPDDLMFLLDADDMNIRGSQLWVAYKDHCGMNVEKLKACLRKRSPELVAAVNAAGAGAVGPELAVTHGGSAR